MSSSSVESNVQKAINESKDFGAIKETTSFDMQIATSTEAAAQTAISQADSMKGMLQMQRDETNQKILNPEMKEVSSGGGCSTGMKEVVDTKKLAENESKLRALDTQLADARSKAESSRDEATRATISRIELSAENEGASSKMKESESLAESFRSLLGSNERVTVEDRNKFTKENDVPEEIISSFQAGNVATQNSQNATSTSQSGNTERRVSEVSAATSSNTD